MNIVRNMDNLRIKGEIPKTLYIFLACSTFLTLFCIWCILTYGGHVQPYFLSSPSDVIKALAKLVSDYGFLSDIKVSTFRIFAGFAISVLLAVPLGILMGCFKVFQALISPFVSFMRYLPVPALVPFCILWFGIGELQKMIIVFIGVFFQLVLMIADIVYDTPDELLETSYTLGAGTRNAIFDVVIPHSMPQIVDGFRITMGWAWGWLILAELVGAKQGIGFMIIKSQRYLLNANMVVGLLVLGLLGVVIDLIFIAIYKTMFRWKANGR